MNTDIHQDDRFVSLKGDRTVRVVVVDSLGERYQIENEATGRKTWTTADKLFRNYAPLI